MRFIIWKKGTGEVPGRHANRLVAVLSLGHLGEAEAPLGMSSFVPLQVLLPLLAYSTAKVAMIVFFWSCLLRGAPL